MMHGKICLLRFNDVSERTFAVGVKPSGFEQIRVDVLARACRLLVSHLSPPVSPKIVLPQVVLYSRSVI